MPNLHGARVTIREVAQRAGVSRATVSYVLNGQHHHTRPETIERVQAAVAELGYVPSAAAKSLRTKRSAVLALVVPSVSTPFYAQFVRGAEDEALARGCTLFVCSSAYSQERERAYAQVLVENQVEGAIFASSLLDPGHLHELRRRGIRVVLLDATPDSPEADGVSFDYEMAAQLAVQHLAGLGHRRIAFVTAPLTRPTRNQRMRGYLAGLAACGLEVDAELICEEPLRRNPRTSNYEVAAAEPIVKRLLGLPNPPTGIFAYNDMAAAIITHGLLSRGVRVPADVSVIGLDDIGIAELLYPSLTTIARPATEMGAAAARLLLDQIAVSHDGQEPESRTVHFAPEVVVRASTSPLGDESQRDGVQAPVLASTTGQQDGASQDDQHAAVPHAAPVDGKDADRA